MLPCALCARHRGLDPVSLGRLPNPRCYSRMERFQLGKPGMMAVLGRSRALNRNPAHSRGLLDYLVQM